MGFEFDDLDGLFAVVGGGDGEAFTFEFAVEDLQKLALGENVASRGTEYLLIDDVILDEQNVSR